MARANYCELFRFHDQYCDVFEEEPGRYLYAEAEPYERPDVLTCKEYAPAARGDGWITSCYSGAAAAYLAGLEPAPADIAAAIIASEERYTLECMANDYGYSREYIAECYRELIDDGEDPHDAFAYTAACMIERDL